MKQSLPYQPGPIGVFDSGYGGLTILSKIREAEKEVRSCRALREAKRKNESILRNQSKRIELIS